MNYDYQTADPTRYIILKEQAAWNRNHPTEAESLLWNYLRCDGLGRPFKRQHIIGDYIVDFVCLSEKLIVEIDGGYHSLPEQVISDEQRTEWLEKRGFRIVRFTNNEVFYDIKDVLETIKEYFEK